MSEDLEFKDIVTRSSADGKLAFKNSGLPLEALLTDPSAEAFALAFSENHGINPAVVRSVLQQAVRQLSALPSPRSDRLPDFFYKFTSIDRISDFLRGDSISLRLTPPADLNDPHDCGPRFPEPDEVLESATGEKIDQLSGAKINWPMAFRALREFDPDCEDFQLMTSIVRPSWLRPCSGLVARKGSP